MSDEIDLDLRGLKCPQPILKIQSKSSTLPTGTVLKASADCSTFERDLNIWASKTGKHVLECTKTGNTWVARIML